MFEHYNKKIYPCSVIHRLRNKNRRVLGGNKYLYALHTFDSKKNSITYFTKYIALMIDKKYVSIRLSNKTQLCTKGNKRVYVNAGRISSFSFGFVVFIFYWPYT